MQLKAGDPHAGAHIKIFRETPVSEQAPPDPGQPDTRKPRWEQLPTADVLAVDTTRKTVHVLERLPNGEAVIEHSHRGSHQRVRVLEGANVRIEGLPEGLPENADTLASTDVQPVKPLTIADGPVSAEGEAVTETVRESEELPEA
jgi:hypothetical protein